VIEFVQIGEWITLLITKRCKLLSQNWFYSWAWL